jgi:hypothetical protein
MDGYGIWILLAIIALIVVWIISIYNGLVAMRQRANQAFADIDVQLKQRHDLIPNLVETVKSYASHEKSTLDAVFRRAMPPSRRRGRRRWRRPRTSCQGRCGSCLRCPRLIRI